jgi:hypothetical protein
MCPKVIGLADILNEVAVCQYDHWQLLQVRLSSDPSEDIKAVNHRQVQIEQQDIWKVAVRANRVANYTVKIVNDLSAIAQNFELVLRAQFVENVLDKIRVIL